MADRTNTGTPNRVRTPPNDSRSSLSTAISPRPRTKDTANTLCRNITIYGYCRFVDKGCIFNHDPQNGKSNGSLGRGKFNVDSPSFTPSTPPKNFMSPKTADAAPFTPKGSSLHNGSTALFSPHHAGTATPPVQPNFGEAGNNYALQHAVDQQNLYGQNLQHSFDALALADNTGAGAMNPYADYSGVPHVTASGQVNPYVQGHGDIFYTPQQNYHMPLNYHLYAPRPPFAPKLTPYQRTTQHFFMSDTLREDLQRASDAALQTMPASSPHLPMSINEFQCLVPLDTTAQKSTQYFGHPSWVYKAFSSEDGNPYVLRRVEGGRLSNDNDIRIIHARWRKVISASMVTVHNAWTTTKFGDNSIIFVYDYHTGSKTLAELHFGPQNQQYTRTTPEPILWSYITQITNALRTIHGAGLAARSIELSKILITGKSRIRLNCCGTLDVLRPDSRPIQEIQAEDLVALGRLILGLACHNPMAYQNFQKNLDFVGKSSTHSAHLRDFIFWLINGTFPSVDKLAEALTNYTFQNFDAALNYNDNLEAELCRELENGRLVRLMSKLGFINERPEFDHDPRWSETGDRYYIKLFRDYVFHSVDENNQPVVDLAHIITCLNKLDAGVDEKIMLVSRDNNNCFVISYKDLKRHIENSFQDLLKAAPRR